MQELLKKIMARAENPEAVDLSEQGVRKAAKELGYSDEQIEDLFSNFDGFPLDEEALNTVSGGASTIAGNRNNMDDLGAGKSTHRFTPGQTIDGSIMIAGIKYKPGDPNLPDLSKFRRK